MSFTDDDRGFSGSRRNNTTQSSFIGDAVSDENTALPNTLLRPYPPDRQEYGMSSATERLAHVAFTIGVFVLGAAAVSNRVDAAKRDDVAEVGDVLPALGGVEWRASHATLVFVLRSTCEFCKANAPLYRELAEVPRTDSLLRVLAVMPERADSASSFLLTHRIDVPWIAGDSLKQALTRWRVRGYPAILLVSRSGRVIHSWQGLQSPAGTAHLRESIDLLRRSTSLDAALSAATVDSHASVAFQSTLHPSPSK